MRWILSQWKVSVYDNVLWEGAFQESCFYVYAPMRDAALSPAHISVDITPLKCAVLLGILMRKDYIIILTTVISVSGNCYQIRVSVSTNGNQACNGQDSIFT